MAQLSQGAENADRVLAIVQESKSLGRDLGGWEISGDWSADGGLGGAGAGFCGGFGLGRMGGQ